MSEKISLREVESQVFRSVFKDGLLELSIGSFVLMFAVGPYLTPYLGDFWGSAIFVPFWLVVFTLLWLIRRYVVKPRTGAFEFGQWRKKRMIRVSATMVAIFVISLLLGVLSLVKFDAVPGWVHTARFSLVIFLTFSLVGYFLGLRRLYLYGVLIAAAPLVGELLWVYWDVPHHGFPVTFGLVTVLITGAGLLQLVRLIRDYPVSELSSSPEAK